MNETMSKAERTKQFIVEKTAPVFNAKGYAGTSINDLMNATGLSKGSIYGNFENKDEVALAAFDYNFGKITAYLKSKISATENAVERLLMYPRADDTHPLLREKAANALISWKKSIENQVKRGMERKEIKPDTNPTEVAVILISMIEGALMQAKVSGKTTELKIAMSYLEKLILSLKA